MSGPSGYYVPGGELSFSTTRSGDDIDSDGSNPPLAKGIDLECTLNQSTESLESRYHDLQTGGADGQVLTVAVTIEQQHQAELAASQAYLNNKRQRVYSARIGKGETLTLKDGQQQAEPQLSLYQGSRLRTTPEFEDIFGGAHRQWDLQHPWHLRRRGKDQ
ncbi:hypothetical protein KEM48_014346 [Puccinia striiformis f. sp. tritici PST-130]|nr:hypothetical protein KEM48_014346 [Puccinia striiformis f. sp. tritici PST-130]